MRSAADLPFVVKICGITNEEDARVAVECGANALGFNFYPRSPRYVEPRAAKQIVDRVAGEYLKVGVFVNGRAEEIAQVTDELTLDVLQIHGEDLCTAAPHSCSIWRAAPADRIPKQAAAEVQAYVIDTPTTDFGGSGKSFDWGLAADLPYRFVLAGGLAADNVKHAIETARPWGVDACSRLESRPGKKDAQRIKEFVRAASCAL